MRIDMNRIATARNLVVGLGGLFTNSPWFIFIKGMLKGIGLFALICLFIAILWYAMGFFGWCAEARIAIIVCICIFGGVGGAMGGR